jgi:ribose 5-phosphate isomerase A
MAVDVNQLKRRAAERAVDWIEPGMVVGLGTGSTAGFAIRRLAELLRDGRLADIVGVPTSRQTEEEALRLGVPLTTLESHPSVDLTIDGADEVAPNLDVIKGGGGALLREKIVAQASHREIIVVDESKLSPALGSAFALPIEVVPWGWRSQAEFLQMLGAAVSLRRGGDDEPFLTDQGNFILDCHFGPISDPQAMAARLQERAGIVEHGLFLGLATDLVVAGEAGIGHLRRAPGGGQEILVEGTEDWFPPQHAGSA